MATYRSFIHVERLEDSKFDIPSFLNGKVFIFPKLDGTNFCAWADVDGKIHCGSRKREISIERDNAESCLYFQTEPQYKQLREWLIDNPDIIVYGEWLHGLNKHAQTGTIKKYKDAGLWIIDVYCDSTGYIPFDTYELWLEGVYQQVVKPLAVIQNPSLKQVEGYVENHFNLPGDVLGEGIVIKNYDYRNFRGNYQVGKIVNAESKVGKGRIKNSKSSMSNDEVVNTIVQFYVTDADCEKAKQKACVKFDLEEWEVNKATMGFYLNALFQDLIEEELWSILKKLKMPTIQFGLLRQQVYMKGRKYLGLI